MLLFGSFVFLLSSVLLSIYNWKHNRVTIYLSLLLFICAIHGISHSLVLSGGPAWLMVFFYNNFSPLYFLIGPLMYLYVDGTLKDRFEFSTKQIVHLLPFLLMVVVVFPYWFSSTDHKFQVISEIINDPKVAGSLSVNWILPPAWNLFLRIFLWIAYLVASLILLVKYDYIKVIKQTSKQQLNTTYRWLLLFLICMGVVYVDYLITGIFNIYYFNIELASYGVSQKQTSNA